MYRRGENEGLLQRRCLNDRDFGKCHPSGFYSYLFYTILDTYYMAQAMKLEQLEQLFGEKKSFANRLKSVKINWKVEQMEQFFPTFSH